jgi:tRNA-splicing ligase RtcB (3'-phosphate/5'-hydroxy nucleic acid ligase)
MEDVNNTVDEELVETNYRVLDTKSKIWDKNIPMESDIFTQISNVSSLPIVAGVSIMPDAHVGKGATVGTVLATRAAVIPATVGVDIGCGMCAVMTSLVADDLPESLFALRNQLERDIPVGFNEHPKDVPSVTGPYADVLRKNLKKTMKRFDTLTMRPLLSRADEKKIGRQMGTLGGGNHFIEICLDTTNRVWIMLHSGSRGIGNQIGTIAIQVAREVAAKRGYGLPDKDLAWLDEGTPEFDQYIEAMHWAQDYARFNRDTMMNIAVAAMKHRFPKMVLLGEVINCHHNFTTLENHNDEDVWVTRKGAVSAQYGQLGIVPGSMGAKSFIVSGKGSSDSFCSCSHGAGRKMSRSAAKRLITLEDHIKATEGIECRKDEDVIDESPAAYKDIDAVIAAQNDLIEVVHTLKQILCIKG